VALDLKDATIQDVAEALAGQTGWRFQFVGRPRPGHEEVVLPEFKAEGRPLKEVLRRACELTGYRFRRPQRELFWLEQGEFQDSPHRAEVEGYRVSVESISLTAGSSTLDFSRGPARQRHSQPRLGVQLVVEAPTDAAAERVHGLDAVVVTDDTGRVSQMPAERGRSRLSQLRFFPTPDKADVNLSFEPPAPGARTVTLDGELVLYRNLEVIEYRFDDLTAGNASVQKGGLEVTLKECRAQDGQCRIQTSSRVLAAVPEPDPEDWNLVGFVLLGEGGERWATQRWRRRPGGSATYGLGIPEDLEPVALIYQVVRRRYPDRFLPFRIADVPLPEAAPGEGTGT
jgi:hypothetical protein